MPTQRTGILSRISKAIGGNAAQSGATGEGFWSGFVGGERQGSGVKRSVGQFLQAYNTQAWLRSGGAKKAQSISDVEWLQLVQDPQTEQMVPLNEILKQKHPIQDFFDNPHPLFSWQTIQFIWSIHLDLTGECFGIWDETKAGLQMWPITPDKITELPQMPEKPYYVLSLKNGQHPIPYDRVFWLVDPNPAAPYSRGSAIAQSIDSELNIYKKTMDTLDGFFDRQARPDILVTGKGLNPEKTKRLESEWREKLQGFWNSFKPYFLNEEVDVREFRQDFQSVQFIELTKLQRNTITQILGLPPEIMGINENSNRAMIEAADLFFAKWTLAPRLNMMREAYQRQIVPKFDDTGLIELDYVSPVTEDKEFEMGVIRSASHAFLLDEIRVKAGEEPLPDGRGQVMAWPMNLTPMRLEDLPAPSEAPVPEPAGTEVPGAPEPLLEPGENPSGPALPVQESIKTWNSNKGRVVRTGRGHIIRILKNR